MDNILKNRQVMETWFSMPISEQISNIGSEVLRADKWKQRGNEARMRGFYNAAIRFLRLSIMDPKNHALVGELNLCIDELADYFIGRNIWQTSSETLKRYYNAFL